MSVLREDHGAYLRTRRGKAWIWRAVCKGFLLSAWLTPVDLRAQISDPLVAGPTRPEQGLEAPRTPISVPQPVVPLLRDQAAPAGVAEITFTFSELRIEGATAIDTDELMAAWPHRPGTVITVSELFQFANQITRIYAEAGYALSFGLVPAQTIKDGPATIRVVEGFVNSI